MKFSDRTLTIIKNFSTINPSLVFKPGSKFRTVSPQKTLLASADIVETIPGTAHIFNVSRLLSIMSLYDDPSLEFGEKQFVITDGRKKTSYTYANPETIIAPGDKEHPRPPADFAAKISWADIQSVVKAADILQLPEIAFVGEDGVAYLKAIKSEDKSADSFSVNIGETNDTFRLVLKTENIKLLPGDYDIELSSKGISKFTAADVTYWVAVEVKSSMYKKG